MRLTAFWGPLALVALSGLWLLVRAIREEAPEPAAPWRPAALTLAFAVFMLHQVRLRADESHLWQALPLVHVMAVWAAFSLGALRSRMKGRAARLALAVAAAAPLAVPVSALALGFRGNELGSGAPSVVKGRTAYWETERARLWLTPAERAESEAVIRAIERWSDPGDPILVLPEAAIYYFLTGRRNPTRFDAFRPGRFRSRAEEGEVVLDLMLRPPKVIVFDPVGVSDGREERVMRRHAALIYDHLASRYRKVADAGKYEVWLPEPGGRRRP